MARYCQAMPRRSHIHVCSCQVCFHYVIVFIITTDSTSQLCVKWYLLYRHVFLWLLLWLIIILYFSGIYVCSWPSYLWVLHLGFRPTPVEYQLEKGGCMQGDRGKASGGGGDNGRKGNRESDEILFQFKTIFKRTENNIWKICVWGRGLPGRVLVLRA